MNSSTKRPRAKPARYSPEPDSKWKSRKINTPVQKQQINKNGSKSTSYIPSYPPPPKSPPVAFSLQKPLNNTYMSKALKPHVDNGIEEPKSLPGAFPFHKPLNNNYTVTAVKPSKENSNPRPKSPPVAFSLKRPVKGHFVSTAIKSSEGNMKSRNKSSCLPRQADKKILSESSHYDSQKPFHPPSSPPASQTFSPRSVSPTLFLDTYTIDKNMNYLPSTGQSHSPSQSIISYPFHEAHHTPPPNTHHSSPPLSAKRSVPPLSSIDSTDRFIPPFTSTQSTDRFIPPFTPTQSTDHFKPPFTSTQSTDHFKPPFTSTQSSDHFMPHFTSTQSKTVTPMPSGNIRPPSHHSAVQPISNLSPIPHITSNQSFHNQLDAETEDDTNETALDNSVDDTDEPTLMDISYPQNKSRFNIGNSLSREEVQQLYSLTTHDLIIKLLGMNKSMQTTLTSMDATIKSMDKKLMMQEREITYLKETIDSPSVGGGTVEKPLKLSEKFPNLPCQTEEDVSTFHNHLKANSDARSNLFKCLRLLGGGGMSAGDHIRAMLLATMKNEVALAYSYTGRGKNIPFQDLIFVDMMLNIIRSFEKYQSYPTKDFQQIVTNWLRNSKKRLQYERRKEAVDAKMKCSESSHLL